MVHILTMSTPHIGLPFRVVIRGGVIESCGFVLEPEGVPTDGTSDAFAAQLLARVTADERTESEVFGNHSDFAAELLARMNGTHRPNGERFVPAGQQGSHPGSRDHDTRDRADVRWGGPRRGETPKPRLDPAATRWGGPRPDEAAYAEYLSRKEKAEKAEKSKSRTSRARSVQSDVHDRRGAAARNLHTLHAGARPGSPRSANARHTGYADTDTSIPGSDDYYEVERVEAPQRRKRRTTRASTSQYTTSEPARDLNGAMEGPGGGWTHRIGNYAWGPPPEPVRRGRGRPRTYVPQPDHTLRISVLMGWGDNKYEGECHFDCDPAEHQLIGAFRVQWEAYLAGNLLAFRLPLAPAPTPFAADLRAAMQRIPWGETVTYSELATMAGHPNAARATGTACRSNPFPLLVPCHRVVPATGGIGRYMGKTGPAGSIIKENLLKFEGFDITSLEKK